MIQQYITDNDKTGWLSLTWVVIVPRTILHIHWHYFTFIQQEGALQFTRQKNTAWLRSQCQVHALIECVARRRAYAAMWKITKPTPRSRSLLTELLLRKPMWHQLPSLTTKSYYTTKSTKNYWSPYKLPHEYHNNSMYEYIKFTICQ